MGLRGPFSSSCSSSPYAAPDSNPDPKRFTILDWEYVNCVAKYLIVKIQYPDARNYEGVKVMVYRGFKDTEELLRATNNMIDPHFSETGVSPIARFAPLHDAMDTAINFALSLVKPKK
jgi:hypothetical protein